MQKFIQNPYTPPKPPTWKNHQTHIKKPTQKNHQTSTTNESKPINHYYLGFTTPQSPILKKTHYHQPKPKSSTNPTNQRKTKNKQTNRPTPTTNPPQPTKPNQSTTTTAWSSQHHSHQSPIRFSQHPLARLQNFPIIFSASRSHGLHNQNLED